MDNIYQIKMDQWLLPIFKPIIEKSYRFLCACAIACNCTCTHVCYLLFIDIQFSHRLIEYYKIKKIVVVIPGRGTSCSILMGTKGKICGLSS